MTGALQSEFFGIHGMLMFTGQGPSELTREEKAAIRSLHRGFFDPIRLESNSIVRGIAHSLPYIHGRCLDLGCGEMPYARLLRGRVTHYVGTDLRSNAAAPPHVVSDSLMLPFRAQSFDTVLCTQVLEHVRNPLLTMAEIARVLRPGGYAVITAPALWPLHEEPHDYFRYTKYGLEELAFRCNLRHVAVAERGGGITAIAQLAGALLYDVFGRRTLPRVLMRIIVAPFLSVCELLDRLLSYRKLTLGYVMIAERIASPGSGVATRTVPGSGATVEGV